jgi:hypothetical protein
MLFIVISMAVIVVVAGLVVTFVAFPHRGEDVPGASWLGDGMSRFADVLPTLEHDEDESTEAIIGRGRHVEDSDVGR